MLVHQAERRGEKVVAFSQQHAGAHFLTAPQDILELVLSERKVFILQKCFAEVERTLQRRIPRANGPGFPDQLPQGTDSLARTSFLHVDSSQVCLGNQPQAAVLSLGSGLRGLFEERTRGLIVTEVKETIALEV